MGLVGEFAGMGGVGHHGQRHRAGQGEGAAITWQVLPEIVDNQAQVGFVGRCRRGLCRGCMGNPGQAAKQGE
ncbi:hypothetical protein D3C81_1891610 [compost metagenome]